VTEFRGANYILPSLCALGAPVLVALMAFKVAVSVLGRMLFGTDPAAGLVDEQSAGWAIVTLTGGCTLGLIVAAVMLRWVM
jgi:hypothetical protein